MDNFELSMNYNNVLVHISSGGYWFKHGSRRELLCHLWRHIV